MPVATDSGELAAYDEKTRRRVFKATLGKALKQCVHAALGK